MPEPSKTRFEITGKRIYVAGHTGMVGRALVRRLSREDCQIVTADRTQVDLTRQEQTTEFLRDVQPDAVIVAAARVGGILANSLQPAEFLYDNLMIESNLIHGAYLAQTSKLLFLGSSCIYPKYAPQPIHEEALLTGTLEPSNEWYAIAKIAGVKLCQAYRNQYGCDFISAMPTNLYGPYDNFNLNSSHVLPALMRKVHEAKLNGASSIEVWGTGEPLREFLHCDDCADALVFLLQNYSAGLHVNVGSGEEISILELTRLICRTLGYSGEIQHNLDRPDGTPRKLMLSDRLRAIGWAPRIELEDGIAQTYAWYKDQMVSAMT